MNRLPVNRQPIAAVLHPIAALVRPTDYNGVKIAARLTANLNDIHGHPFTLVGNATQGVKGIHLNNTVSGGSSARLTGGNATAGLDFTQSFWLAVEVEFVSDPGNPGHVMAPWTNWGCDFVKIDGALHTMVMDCGGSDGVIRFSIYNIADGQPHQWSQFVAGDLTTITPEVGGSMRIIGSFVNGHGTQIFLQFVHADGSLQGAAMMHENQTWWAEADAVDNAATEMRVGPTYTGTEPPEQYLRNTIWAQGVPPAQISGSSALPGSYLYDPAALITSLP